MIDRARAGLLGGLLASTFLTGLPFAQAASVDVLGAPGIDGTDGTAATPDGGPGGPGGIAEAIIPASADADNRAHAVGGDGGTGGSGFTSWPAVLGNGGVGGNGGPASSSAVARTENVSTTAVQSTSYGGRGGDGGNAYSSSKTGAGGDGGAATSSAAAVGGGDVSVSAGAFGGQGGFSVSSSGQGGTARMGAVSGYSTQGGDVGVNAVAQGGHGGEGVGYPDERLSGGRGGDAFIIDQVTGDTTGRLVLEQSAVGGDGGSAAVWPDDGGNASSSLTNRSSSKAVVGISTAAGGNGGAMIGGGGHGSRTGNGGAATASLFLEALGNIAATATARGGSAGGGGEGYVRDGTVPGQGGSATLGPVIARSTGGGSVTITGRAEGGGGGGSAIADNALRGETAGALVLTQEAVGAAGTPGHNGFDGVTARAGGFARSILQRRAADFDVLPASLVATTMAVGGQGGEDHGFDDGSGGSATAITDIVLDGIPGSAVATARGGNSGTFAGEARAVARTGGELATAEAAGGDSGAYGPAYVNGYAGGASAHAQSTAEAYAAATGGSNVTGYAFGGGAVAEALATGTGVRPVRAESRAQAGSGFVDFIGPFYGGATSDARASNLGGQDAEAFSSASGFNPMNGAHAVTAASGIVAFVGAHAETTQQTPEFPFLPTEGAAQARAGYGTVALPEPVNAPLAAAVAIAIPDATDLTARIAGNVNVAGRFPLAPARTVAGWGLLAGEYQPVYWLDTNRTLLSNRLEFTLDTAAFLAGGGVPGSLAFGLFNPAIGEAGFESLTFDILEDGLSILPGGLVSFTGPAEAFAYFDDRVLDLGAWTSAPWFQAGETTLDLAVVLSAAFDAEDQSFSTEMVFGIGAFGSGAQPVPLPAAAWLFAGGLAGLGLLGVRRRAV